jgi:long-chain acyl-CoA synthetase
MGQTFCIPERGTSKIQYSKPVGSPQSDDETAGYRFEGIQEFLRTPSEDCKTAFDLFQHGLRLNPKGDCVGSKKADGPGYEWLSYEDVFNRAKNVGSGFLHLDLCPLIKHPKELYNKTWRFIGVMTKNRIEFALIEQAANCYGVTIVPVYDTLGPDTLNYICTQTKMKTLCCANETLPTIIKSFKSGESHDLDTIVTFADPTQEEIDLAASVGLKVLSFADVEKAGESSPQPLSPPRPEDVNTFCYTSGTTGMPKGAMITHSQFTAICAGALKLPGLDLCNTDVYLSYLPIAHILERIVNQCFYYLGAKIGYYRGDTLKIVDDCQELKPTIFVSVPRLYNRIYDKVIAGAEAAGGLKKKLFYLALNSKLERVKQDGCVSHPIWDRLVFAKTKSILGGNVRLMLTGAAPISAHVHDALKCIFCVPIAEGFGMTESCGATCISRVDDPQTGHVGGPLGGAEIKLVSVPEMSYSVHDVDGETGLVQPRGEICVRGPTVFPGYFMDPEKTKEAFDKDGWLRTGDIGVIRPNGSLKIIDRRKNIFKLAQGEYVAAEKIEITYQQAGSISQCFIDGKSTETFVVAIVVPDPDFAKSWWKEHKSSEYPGVEAICKDQDFISKIKADMIEREKEDKLNGFEKAKKFHLSPEGFTVENNLLTPTFKLKRKDAREKYSHEIEKMYAA